MQKSGVVWGNGHGKTGGFYSSKTRRPQTTEVFSQRGRCQTPGKKELLRKLFEGRRNKINTISKMFNFCEYDYTLAVNTHFTELSNLNSFTNFVLLMTNDGLLESSHQGDFVLGFLAGGRHNYKHNNLVQGKQTVVLVS